MATNPTPPPVAPMPNPTEADLADPVFEALWQEVKSWDVNVPRFYQGYCGASGSHVMLLLAIVRPFLLAEAQGRLPVDVIALHRPATSDEHGIDGSIHGFCVRCRTPWPCDYSPEKRDTLTQQLAERELRPFDKIAADRLADEVNVLVRRKVIDARSPAGDALLDYRDPPPSPRGDRMALLEQQLAARTAEVEQRHETSDEWRKVWLILDEAGVGVGTLPERVRMLRVQRYDAHTDAAALRLQVARLRTAVDALFNDRLFVVALAFAQRVRDVRAALTPDPGAADSRAPEASSAPSVPSAESLEAGRRRLVHCTYCNKGHSVAVGEKPCAPGAWLDADAVVA